MSGVVFERSFVNAEVCVVPILKDGVLGAIYTRTVLYVLFRHLMVQFKSARFYACYSISGFFLSLIEWRLPIIWAS